jgi:hypothetical protein
VLITLVIYLIFSPSLSPLVHAFAVVRPIAQTIKLQMTQTKKKRDKFRLRVVAADRGDPPLWAEVDVELDVVDRNNKPPLWDMTTYGPIYVKENVTVGTVVTSVKAR